MKSVQYNRFSFFTLVLLSCLLFSCARKASFEKSVAVPSASGNVKVKKDDNNNYTIEVNVKDLTLPSNLVPAKKVYLVWNQAGNGTFNIGQLISSRSFISRGYKASLTTTSPNKPNRIYITAEDNANTLAPGPQVVLTTPSF